MVPTNVLFFINSYKNQFCVTCWNIDYRFWLSCKPWSHQALAIQACSHVSTRLSIIVILQKSKTQQKNNKLDK